MANVVETVPCGEIPGRNEVSWSSSFHLPQTQNKNRYCKLQTSRCWPVGISTKSRSSVSTQLVSWFSPPSKFSPSRFVTWILFFIDCDFVGERNLSLYDIIFSFKHRPPAGPYKIYILVPMLNHFVYANIKLHILLIKSLTIATAGKFDEARFQVFSSIVRFARAVEVYAVRAKSNFQPFRQFEVEFKNLRLFFTFKRFLLNFVNFNRLSYF